MRKYSELAKQRQYIKVKAPAELETVGARG
jgi:hypothetical protein